MDSRRHEGNSDRGSVLVAVMGIMAVVTVLALGAFTLADDTMFQSNRNRNSTVALHVAEAGMDAAMWQIRKIGDGIDPDSDGTHTFQVPTETGEATVTALKVGAFQYKITSVGHSTAAPGVTRTLSSTVFYVSLWNFVMGAGSLAAGGGGGSLVGNTSVRGPFYIRGDLPMSGNSNLQEGPLFVKKGNINLGGSSSIGTISEPVDVFCDGTYPTPMQGGFWANVSSNVPDLKLPPLGNSQMQQNYATAKSESLDGRKGTDGSLGPNNELRAGVGKVGLTNPTYYKVIDSDDAMGGGTRNFVIDGALTSFGEPDDDLAWDAATGTLYIGGTVFVDGDLTVNRNIRYTGNGTLVVSGNVYVNGEMLSSGVYPTEDAVGIVTPNRITVGVTSGNDPNPTYEDASIAGAWYAGQELKFTKHIVVRGSMLTSILNFAANNNHLLTDPQLPAHLPPAMPGGTDLVVFPTRWHEGNN